MFSFKFLINFFILFLCFRVNLFQKSEEIKTITTTKTKINNNFCENDEKSCHFYIDKGKIGKNLNLSKIYVKNIPLYSKWNWNNYTLQQQQQQYENDQKGNFVLNENKTLIITAIKDEKRKFENENEKGR